MKVKLTPLNIITALSFTLFFVVLFQPKPHEPRHIDVKGIYKFLLGSLVVVTFITDLIFRFTLKDLKRIWIVETSFIIFALVLIVLFKWI